MSESIVEACERETKHSQVPGTHFCRCTHVMFDCGDETMTYQGMVAAGAVGEFLPPTATEMVEYLESEIGLLRAEKVQLVDTLRILAEGLFGSASGTLEGPGIKDLLEKVGLIKWVRSSSENPDYVLGRYGSAVEDGDRIWLMTPFAEELLRHEDLPASPSATMEEP